MDYRIIKGFDILERSDLYSWHWAIEEEAILEVYNDKSNAIIMHVSFTVGNPPQGMERKVNVCIGELPVIHSITNEYCELDLWIDGKSSKRIEFRTNEDSVHIDGDSRTFFFQLFDFKIIKEEIEELDTRKILGKIHNVEIGILKEFICVCDKYNLKYYLFYGSLLGAIRHEGIIPWDDDVDVVMPRKDYDKLIQNAKVAFPSRFFLQTIWTDNNCFFGGFAKLRDCTTSAIQFSDNIERGNEGISIDIMPLDNFPENPYKRKKLLNRIRKYQKKILFKTYKHFRKDLFYVSKSEYYIMKLIDIFSSRDSLICGLMRQIDICNQENSEYVAVLLRYMQENKLQFYEKNDFKDGNIVPFENIEVRIPSNYLKCAKMAAGEQFLKFPDKNERISHHNVWWNTEKSYVEINNQIKDIDIFLKSEKELILMGEKDTVTKFYRAYKKQKNPKYFVSMNEGEQGTILDNILMISPEKLNELTDINNYEIIICSTDEKKYKNLLQKMGIDGYNVSIDLCGRYILSKDVHMQYGGWKWIDTV